MKHRTIPIFIPEVSCPNQCIYCNQRVISGQQQMPSDEEITATIETYASTFDDDTFVEIGFFGGNFTGIPFPEQKRLINLVKPLFSRYKIQGIRLSTRPDYITPEIVSFLKDNGVTVIELGVQSLDDGVLLNVQRGYTSRQVFEAAEIINGSGIELGMQMMLGLPGDTAEKAYRTAQQIVGSGAKNARIYPTLVVQHTRLAEMYRAGEYRPLSLDEAVMQTKDILYLFETSGITVLRVGLHPTEGFVSGTDYLAGPFHVAFKEMVQTEIWHDILSEIDVPASEITIHVPERQINAAVGHKGKNKKMLLGRYRTVQFVPDRNLDMYAFRAEKKITGTQ